MASLALITILYINVLTIFAQSCNNCEIPGLHGLSLEEQSILADSRNPQFIPQHGFVYVPVCSHCEPPAYHHHIPHNCPNAQHHQEVKLHHDGQQIIHHQGTGISHQVLKQTYQYGQDHGTYENDETSHKKNVQYEFEYAVQDHKTGDIKMHRESRKGDVVNGEYSLVEEDGNVRTVKYYADWKTGFHAEIHNSKQKAIG